MAAATLTHTQTRTDTVPPAALAAAPYRVVDTVTASVNIDDAVFVFKVADGLFDHVATVLDMATYYDTLLAAQGAAHLFYRQNAVTKDFADVSTAIDFGAMLIARMTSLCTEYDLVTTSFIAGSPQTQTLP